MLAHITSRFLSKGRVLNSLCRRAPLSGAVVHKQTVSHQIQNHLPAALQTYRSLIGRRGIHKEASVEVLHHYNDFLLPPAAAASAAPESENASSPPTFNALVVVNQPLADFTPHLWHHSKLKVCADGGANRIFDEMPLFFPHESLISVRQRYKPDLIIGNMDSIRPEVMEFYVLGCINTLIWAKSGLN